MQGWKTIAGAAALFAASAAARWGFNVDPAIIADTLIIVGPALMALFRAVTRSPIGQKE